MTISIPEISPIVSRRPLESLERSEDMARAFEAAILAEMLQAAGAGQSATSFGGGVGEDQFASFLLHAQAEQIAKRGGIGLAEMAMRSLMSSQATGKPS